MTATLERCGQSSRRSGHGERCELPHGHDGLHQAQQYDGSLYRWQRGYPAE